MTVFRFYEEKYQDKGFELIGFFDQGMRQMTSNIKVQSPDDMQGQKIRVMENQLHISIWQALGANPTPMAFSEVYMALQQGTIDAQENPFEVIYANRLYEQQDYVILTNHLPASRPERYRQGADHGCGQGRHSVFQRTVRRPAL